MTNGRTESSTFDNLLSPSSWLTSINFINHLVLFNNIVMTGVCESGGGKSSFIQCIRKHLDRSIQCVAVLAEANFSLQRLTGILHDNFHFSLANGVNIQNLCRQINERQKHVLLIIDDAHHLDDALIEEILNTIQSQGETSFFHVLLMADYSILPSLNALTKTAYKDLIHTLEVGPLSLPETSTYIKRRAVMSGLTQDIDDKALITEFYAHTDGSISLINASFEEFFTKHRKRYRKAGKIVSIKAVASLMIFLGILGGSFAYWQRFDYSEVKEKINRFGMAFHLKSNPLNSGVGQKYISSLPAIASVHLEQSDRKNIASILVSLKWSDTKMLPSYLLSISDEMIARNQTAKPILVSTINRVPLSSDIPSVHLSKQKSQIRYTVQIAAAPDPAPLQKMIRAQGFTLPVHIYKTLHKDKIWYILTMGGFDALDKAQTAIGQLPSKLTRYKPWIRPVASIQAEETNA